VGVARYTDTAKGNDNSPGATALQSKAKMCNGRRHEPQCPACADEK